MATQTATINVIASGLNITKSQVEDRDRVIPYRPQYNRITGKVTASLLLQQIVYWWYKQGCKPFYKFKQPCDHDLYREGDSWCEEMEIGRSAFDTALRCLGKKITKGTNKGEALRHHIVIYWTDSDRLTWYQVNENLLGAYVYMAYNEPELLGKVGNQLYLDEDDLVRYLDEDGNQLYLLSESTSEITTEEQSASADDLPALSTPETVETFDDLFPPADEKEDPSARGREQTESILVQTDPLSMAAECAKRRNGDIPDWAMNGEGPSPWWEPLKAFCTITHRPAEHMTGKTGKGWLRQFAKIGEDKGIPPPLMEQATTALPGVQGVKWYISNNKWTSPWCDSYILLLDMLAAQMKAGLQVQREGHIVIREDWYTTARK